MNHFSPTPRKQANFKTIHLWGNKMCYSWGTTPPPGSSSNDDDLMIKCVGPTHLIIKSSSLELDPGGGGVRLFLIIKSRVKTANQFCLDAPYNYFRDKNRGFCFWFGLSNTFPRPWFCLANLESKAIYGRFSIFDLVSCISIPAIFDFDLWFCLVKTHGLPNNCPDWCLIIRNSASKTPNPFWLEKSHLTWI